MTFPKYLRSQPMDKSKTKTSVLLRYLLFITITYRTTSRTMARSKNIAAISILISPPAMGL